LNYPNFNHKKGSLYLEVVICTILANKSYYLERLIHVSKLLAKTFLSIAKQRFSCLRNYETYSSTFSKC